MRRDAARCVRCGLAGTEVDHRTELIDGGAPYDLENLQTLCPSCHDAKSSEARYRRAVRAGNSWGRMELCPHCTGTGICPICRAGPHACTICLGARVVPERAAVDGAVPSQAVLGQVSATAWTGAQVATDRPGA